MLTRRSVTKRDDAGAKGPAVADTGETLALVKGLMAQHAGEVRTLVLFAKPRSIIEPDYVWKRTDNWITFPWSALPPVTRSAQAAVPGRKPA